MQISVTSPTQPTPRMDHVLVKVDELLVVFGGYYYNHHYDDTWFFDTSNRSAQRTLALSLNSIAKERAVRS